MKKFIALMLCLMVVCAPVVAFAEGDADSVVTEEVKEGDISTPETETPAEDEILPPTETPEELPTETPEEKPPVSTPPAETQPTFEEEVEMVTDQIVAWIYANVEEIGVIVTLIGYGIVLISRVRTLIKSTGTINNNAITISKASTEAIAQALAKVEAASGAVAGFDARMATLLEAFKTTAEDKAKLEAELVEIKEYLKTSSKSNLEFADELSELLSLSNIPNYKKEEIGKRHVAAKREIVDAELKAELKVNSMIPTTTEEVKGNVGEEA